METAVLLSNMDNLLMYFSQVESFSKYNETFYAQLHEIDFSKIYADFTQRPLHRIYFGNEFCEFLIPSDSEVLSAYSFAEAHGKAFTLVTPYVTNCGMEKLRCICAKLAQMSANVEIVANDWGVVAFLREEWPCFTIVAGRLLDKSFKDARILPDCYEQIFSPDGFRFIKNSSITSISYQEICTEFGVYRFDLDVPPQGYEDLKIPSEMHASLYYPFGYLVNGRNCMMRSLGRNHENKFIFDGICKKQCRNYNQMMIKDIIMPKGLHTLHLPRKGNTVFYTLSSEMVATLDENRFADRIVYEPFLPM